MINGLDPGNLSSPTQLPNSHPLIEDVLNDGFNACPAELAALKQRNAAETALNNQFTKYQKDFENLKNTLGNSLNTFLTDLGNAFLGTNPKLLGLLGEIESIEHAGSLVGLAGELNRGFATRAGGGEVLHGG